MQLTHPTCIVTVLLFFVVGNVVIACMQHMKNRALREQIYRAYVSRASDVNSVLALDTAAADRQWDNTPIIERMLYLRQRMATMLGYPHFAAMSLARKMAGEVSTVTTMINELHEASYNAASRELKEVEAFARGSEGGLREDEEFKLWDVSYWSERLREKQYGFKEEELKVYFPLPSVLRGLFTLATRLFSIKIEEVPCRPTAGEEAVDSWHEDVQFFNVLDVDTGKVVAAFFLDPYSRPAEKNGGAWMDVCVQRSRAMGESVPVAYVICNGSVPVLGSDGVTVEIPALMTFREVETLFHEFGHSLQHMLTREEYGDTAGINNIEW